MNTQIDRQPSVARALEIAQQLLVVAECLNLLIRAAVKHGQAAAEVAFDAAFQNRPRHRLALKIHIGEGNRAALQHFGNGDVYKRQAQTDGILAFPPRN